MVQPNQITRLTLCAASAILLAAQSANAHTVFQDKEINEGERVYNGIVIGHTCENKGVIANSVVFPDGRDSPITVNDAAAPKGAVVDDYLVAYGNNVRMIKSKDVFIKSAEKWDPNSIDPATGLPENRVGFHSWSGKMGKTDLVVLPIRLEAFTINEASCAKSVTLKVAIADVCVKGLNRQYNSEHVNLWTPALDGSIYNGDPSNPHHYNAPASLTINRVSALPSGCGAGEDVVITPSAAQINRDLGIPKVWSLKP